MSNQITPLNDDNYGIINEQIFFVKVNYFYVPFFSPSRDTILSALKQTDETVIYILDVQFDSNNNAICKCQVNPGVPSVTVSQADQYVMNAFQYISANITRLFGLSISQTFFTDDDNFPDTSSTLDDSLGSGTTVNPSGTDAGNQVTTTIGSALQQLGSATTKTTIIIGILLIIVVVGLFAFAKVEKDA